MAVALSRNEACSARHRVPITAPSCEQCLISVQIECRPEQKHTWRARPAGKQRPERGIVTCPVCRPQRGEHDARGASVDEQCTCKLSFRRMLH